MTKNLMAVISAAVFLILIALAIRAWRSRVADQRAAFSEPNEALEFFGELISSAQGFYAATTFATNHLERIAAYGLGSRGFAQIFVFAEGVLVVRTGERPLAIDKAQLDSVALGQATIDKAVEKEGLLQINWRQDNTLLTTHIRITDQIIRNHILQAIETITSKEVTK